MSGKLMGAIYGLAIPRHLREVALAMADHADDNGVGVFPSIGRLAWKLGVDRRTVQRNVRELERLRVLVKVADATSRRPAEWRIEIDHCERKEPYVPPSRHRLGGGARTAPEGNATDDTGAAPDGTARGDMSAFEARRSRQWVRRQRSHGASSTPPESPRTSHESSSQSPTGGNENSTNPYLLALVQRSREAFPDRANGQAGRRPVDEDFSAGADSREAEAAAAALGLSHYDE